jgi:hypothetical protein
MEWIDVNEKRPNDLEDVELQYKLPFNTIDTKHAVYYSDIDCYKLMNGYYAKFPLSWRPLCPNLERESNIENKSKYFWE